MSVRKRYVRPETVESRMSLAVTKHNSRNTEALLAEGVDPNLRYDRSPIIFSATLPNLRVLVAHGADIDMTNEEGYTLLNLLCHSHRTNAPRFNETDRIRFILENGAEPNLADTDGGDTPLHAICMKSTDPAIIRLLLQHRANPNQQNNNGETPLHSLAGNALIFTGRPILPYRESVEALLAGGAHPNTRDESNQLPSDHARTALTDPILHIIGDLEQEFVTYLEHIEQGIPPPPPGAAPAAPAAAAAPMNGYDPFNNIPNYHGNNGNNRNNRNNGNNGYRPPPPPAPLHVIRNRQNHPNVVVPIGNNENNGDNGNRNNRNQYPVGANENRVGGRRHRRGRTVTRGKGKGKGKGKGQRHTVRTRRH